MAHWRGRRGSLNIDDEGTPTQCTTLIEDGVLRGYMQDRLNARLMGGSSTGNGRRESFAHVTMPRMTNTYMRSGPYDPAEIIASVPRGIYAVNFGGGQVDITSGKFVFSASEAYLIEHGRIGAPIKGATLIGNGPDVLLRVAMVGNDLKLDEGIGVCGKEGQSVPVGVGQPTLRIDGLTVGGTGPCLAIENRGRGVRVLDAAAVARALVDVQQLVLTDRHHVTVVEIVIAHALGLQVDAVGAVQILDDAALRRGDDLAVMAADEAAVDLQIVGRRAADDEPSRMELVLAHGLAGRSQQDARQRYAERPSPPPCGSRSGGTCSAAAACRSCAGLPRISRLPVRDAYSTQCSSPMATRTSSSVTDPRPAWTPTASRYRTAC